MAENTPNTPVGAEPPKPAESSKVQPKKETVRINLPPKPTSAPSIKIHAGGGAAASGIAPAAPPAPAPAPVAAKPAAPAAAKPAASIRTAASPPSAPVMPRPALPARPSGAMVTGLDKGLAIAAVVVSALVLVRLLLL